MFPAASAGAIPPRRERQWRAPAHDQASHTDRLTDRVVQELIACPERPAVELGDDPRVVVEILGRARSELLHLGDRHADVPNLARNELVGTSADCLGDFAECRPPLSSL